MHVGFAMYLQVRPLATGAFLIIRQSLYLVLAFKSTLSLLIKTVELKVASGNPGKKKSQNKEKKKTLQFRKKELQKFTKIVLGRVKSTEKA